MTKFFVKYLTILIFISGCGYSPIFSKKNSNFSINEIVFSGNNNLNRLINNKLNTYKNQNTNKIFSLSINTNSRKEISSKDSKGNPKTFKIEVKSKILIKDSEGEIKEKLFIRSASYNNRSDKFELKKFENQTTKNLAIKISEEIIIYLQSV